MDCMLFAWQDFSSVQHSEAPQHPHILFLDFSWIFSPLLLINKQIPKTPFTTPVSIDLPLIRLLEQDRLVLGVYAGQSISFPRHVPLPEFQCNHQESTSPGSPGLQSGTSWP